MSDRWHFANYVFGTNYRENLGLVQGLGRGNTLDMGLGKFVVWERVLLSTVVEVRVGARVNVTTSVKVSIGGLILG